MKRAGLKETRIFSVVAALLMVIMFLPGKVLAEEQTEILFDGTAEVIAQSEDFSTGEDDEDRLLVTGIEESYDFTGEEICPEPSVTYHGEELIKNTDYEVSYIGMDYEGFYNEDVVNAGTKILTVTGLGAYAGKTTEKEYKINRISLEAAAVTLSDGDGVLEDGTVTYIYTGGRITPEPIVTLGSRILRKGSDYEVNYYNAEEQDTDLVNVSNGAKLTVVVTSTLHGNYDGEAIARPAYTIIPKDITPDVTLSRASYTWDGYIKTPTVTVKDDGILLEPDVDYTVSLSAGTSGRRDVGAYEVTVKLKGNYRGSKTVSFRIKPKGTSLKTLTAGTKAFTVRWNAQKTKMSSSVITGYQLQYSREEDFSSRKKTVNIKGAGKVSKTIKDLKAKKTYYVRIRTYKTVNGVRYFSSWSKVLQVKTK